MATKHLTASDMINIRDAANQLGKRPRAFGPYTGPKTLVVGGRLIPVDISHKSGEDIEDVKASFSLEKRSLDIKCFGLEMQPDDRTCKHLVRIIAHETSHAIQFDDWSPDQIRDADRLQRFVEKTGQPDDYVSYVSCPVELSAHAAMIAADLHAGSHTDESFESAAISTWSYRYIASKGANGVRLIDLQEELIAEALAAYKSMRS